jgi:hypothetical protein
VLHRLLEQRLNANHIALGIDECSTEDQAAFRWMCSHWGAAESIRLNFDYTYVEAWRFKACDAKIMITSLIMHACMHTCTFIELPFAAKSGQITPSGV